MRTCAPAETDPVAVVELAAMPKAPRIVQVAIPAPLRKAFDYLPPRGTPEPLPGVRVRVPFGRRRAIGIVLGSGRGAGLDLGRLKRIEAVLDARPLLPPAVHQLLHRSAAYYRSPVGESYAAARPAATSWCGTGPDVRRTTTFSLR